jgi:hypothetical protein
MALVGNEAHKGFAMRARLALFIAASGLSVLSACGPQVGSGPGGEDEADADPARPDAHPGTGSGCETTPQCEGPLVCDRESGECSDSIACSEHSDCGDAAYCTGSGTCRKAQTGSPCDDESNCLGGDDCFNGFCGCEGTAFAADPVPVNMLIVLDRSNSMQCHVEFHDNDNLDKIGFQDPNSRWQGALGAIGSLLGSYDASIAFGLALFPGTNLTGPAGSNSAVCDPGASGFCPDDGDEPACTVGNRAVEVQQGAGSQITNALNQSANAPAGCTPSGPSLNAQVGYQELADPDAENFVLYITDGAETCENEQSGEFQPGQVTAIANLRNQDPEVRTFVVGFTEAVSAADLNAAAEAGGTARDGQLKYYQANDEAALTAALEEIGGLALSCSFTLDSAPPDLDDLFVYVGNQSIIRDTSQQNGWDFDPATNRVTLYGGSCDAAQSGSAEDVTILHGCPIVVD